MECFLRCAAGRKREGRIASLKEQLSAFATNAEGKGDAQYRKRAGRAVSCLLFLGAGGYGIYLLFDGSLVPGLLYLGCALAAAVSYLLLHGAGNGGALSVSVLCELLVLTSTSLYFGRFENYFVSWVAVVPIAFYFLAGSRVGLIFNIALLGAVSVTLVIHRDSFVTQRVVINILVSMSVLCIAFYINERNRERALERLRQKQNALEVLSNTDRLTGLCNRTWIDARLQREVAERTGDGGPRALAILDVDHFKRVNDQYGHLEGDRALVAVAGVISQCAAREGGCCEAARWGGEEFLLYVRGDSREQIFACVEQVRALVEALTFDNGRRVSLSAGLAFFRSGDTYDALLRRADDALYRAKEHGRNRVVTESEKECPAKPKT